MIERGDLSVLVELEAGNPLVPVVKLQVQFKQLAGDKRILQGSALCPVEQLKRSGRPELFVRGHLKDWMGSMGVALFFAEAHAAVVRMVKDAQAHEAASLRAD